MRLLILFLAMTALDDMPPIPSPNPTPIPVEPAPPLAPPLVPVPTPAELRIMEEEAKARQKIVKEIDFCKAWFGNLTKKQFYMKWDEDKFNSLSPEAQMVFFIQQASHLETRMRKLSWSLTEAIHRTNGLNRKVFDEATQFNSEIMALRKQLAVRREQLIQAGIAQYPALMSGLKLQLKHLNQYNQDNELKESK